jgi:hypothetical protein
MLMADRGVWGAAAASPHPQSVKRRKLPTHIAPSQLRKTWLSMGRPQRERGEALRLAPAKRGDSDHLNAVRIYR